MRTAAIIALLITGTGITHPSEFSLSPWRVAEADDAGYCVHHPATQHYFACSRLYMVCAAGMQDGWYPAEGYWECAPGAVYPPSSAAELYGDPADAPDWRAKFAQCKCIKNVDGKCMTFGSGPYPYRQRDEAIESPHCVSGCYPDFSDVYGPTTQLRRELAHCYIDWGRLEKARK